MGNLQILHLNFFAIIPIFKKNYSPYLIGDRDKLRYLPGFIQRRKRIIF